MKKNLFISVIISSLFIVALSANVVETRCGWLFNPKPRNWYLIDNDGRWIISQQGGYEAKGMDNLPKLVKQQK